MTRSRLHAVTPVVDPPQGDAALVAVDRALSELRRGRAVVVQDAAARIWRLVVPLETAGLDEADRKFLASRSPRQVG